MRPGAAPALPWRDRDADEGYGATASPDWRQTDWARELKRVEIDGVPINYVDVGSGDQDPVVLVHGLGGQWQNWLENIPRLAQERRVLALDLPGFGLTPEPSGGEISIPGYGRTVDAFCEKLGLGKVDMVGNSMGGFVAAEVAIQFPGRLSRLVLVSAAGITSADTLQAPILTFGRVATAIVDEQRGTSPADRRTAARAARGARPRGAASATTEAGPGVRGLLQGRWQGRLRRRPPCLPRLRLPRTAS